MERRIIGIVEIVSVVKSGTAQIDDIIAFKFKIAILEAYFFNIWQNNVANQVSLV
jgi:hypothetical protein